MCNNKFRWQQMDLRVFDSLEVCDPTLAWELMRHHVVDELLGSGPIPVPFLDESYSFQPFSDAVINIYV